MTANLNTLRNAPDAQKQIFDDFTAEAVRLRSNPLLAFDAMKNRINQLVDTAQNDLQSLQDSCNTAETAIRNAAGVLDSSEPSPVALDKIKLGLAHGKDVDGLAQLFVKQGDRSGLQALRGYIPFISANSLEEKNLLSLVAGREQQLFTDAEKAAALEVQEVNANMGLLRSNFTTLFDFFKRCNEQTYVSGQFAPPQFIFTWTPFSNGKPGAGDSRVRLSDGLASSDPRNQFFPAQNDYAVVSTQPSQYLNPLDYMFRR